MKKLIMVLLFIAIAYPIWAIPPMPGGDMYKSVYDTNNDGVVDSTASADNMTVADTNATNTFIGLWNSATGSQKPKSDGALTYNATTGLLSSTLFGGAFNGTIGATTPAAGSFTSVTNSGLTATRVPFAGAGGLLSDDSDLTFATDTLTATKFSGALNGTVGETTPAAGSFTTLAASSTVSGNGFSAYLASPPAIGGIAPAAGTFTAVTADSYSTNRTDAAQCISLFEATSDGDDNVTICVPAKGTGLAAHADITLSKSLAFTGTMTDAKYCTYASSGNVISCNETPAGAGDFLADGSVPMTGDLTITSATPDIVLNDSDDAAGTASIKANSSGGTNDIILTIGVEDSSGAGTSYIEVDGVSETIDLLMPTVIGSDGVKLTGSNGALTILGIGDGQDEDIKIDLNTTANTVEITSPASSATAIDFNTLNLVATGYISGAINVLDDSDNHTVTGAEAYGFMGFATGAGTWQLPAAAAGMNLCVYSQGANAVKVRAEASDVLVLNGTAGTAGHAVVSASAAGDFICVVARDTTNWYTLGRSGTWTAE